MTGAVTGGEKEQGEKGSSIHWFTHQGTPSRFFTGMSKAQVLGPLSTAYPSVLAGSTIRSEQPRLELAL